jgi:hypothetical protein
MSPILHSSGNCSGDGKRPAKIKSRIITKLDTYTVTILFLMILY